MARRILSEEEKRLWKQVTKTVEPLIVERHPSASWDLAEAESNPSLRWDDDSKPLIRYSRSASSKNPTPNPKPEIAPTALDRPTTQKLRKGAYPIDATLDLHFLDQKQAHRALVTFVTAHLEAGSRYLLVITGKGKAGDDSGVLRRALPQWLEVAPLREHVVAYGQASRPHGGSGAYYIQLRRRKERL